MRVGSPAVNSERRRTIPLLFRLRHGPNVDPDCRLITVARSGNMGRKEVAAGLGTQTTVSALKAVEAR